MRNGLILLALFAFGSFWGCQPQKEKWSSLEIRQLTDGEKPEPKNAVAGDVFVFESGSPAFSMYQFMYYHAFSGELKPYGAVYGKEGGFEKGFYQWKDDTTVVVKMVYSNGDSIQMLELFGNGPRSSMRIETED
ncbi:MAG: hypothetical protein GC178_03060 [Flavobacteriales bacterium]|nr:hypothetical protein [Flavobacteriales bacterium]